MFVKNAWYVASRIEDIAEKPLARTICNEKMVFYRAKENKVAAVEDFCPHRGAPLSLGFVENGELVCGYHGLVMGQDGKVISMPSQRVRGFPCNKTYATIEKYGFVWVWPGDQSLATEEQLPALEWADNPEWAYDGGLFHINCDYKLMIDNLMDLTHETYVHSSSIGQKEIDDALPKTLIEGDKVITERFMENVEAPPFWKMALRGNQLADDVLVDRWQRCHFLLRVMFISKWVSRMQAKVAIKQSLKTKYHQSLLILLPLKLKLLIGISGEWLATFKRKITN